MDYWFMVVGVLADDYKSRIQIVEQELKPPTNDTGDPLRSATAALTTQSWSLGGYKVA